MRPHVIWICILFVLFLYFYFYIKSSLSGHSGQHKSSFLLSRRRVIFRLLAAPCRPVLRRWRPASGRTTPSSRRTSSRITRSPKALMSVLGMTCRTGPRNRRPRPHRGCGPCQSPFRFGPQNRNRSHQKALELPVRARLRQAPMVSLGSPCMVTCVRQLLASCPVIVRFRQTILGHSRKQADHKLFLSISELLGVRQAKEQRIGRMAE